jgi:RimJ/RimL family protein N-acetyltransferase
MLKYLTRRRDIGVHSDVITDSIVDLVEKGIINGKEKSLHPGKIVTSYCLGTRRLYDLIDNNPLFSFYPIEYVCDPSIISKNNKMVSVTQALAVDLMGQVCSDQFAGELYSGISTQPDFLRGTANSLEGKPIICLASTTENGRESRIRPLLREGEGVSIPRSDVHYVVTECGTAYLFGKTIQEKALALIEIAHPSFRSELLDAAKRLGYLRSGQGLKCKADGTIECWYPQEEEREFMLKNNTKIVVRPSKASDVNGLQNLFYQLPPEDVYTRFFRNLKCLSVSEAEHLCNVDYNKEMAFVITAGERENEKIVGSSFYAVNPSTHMADVAYMVLHEWQGMGLGTILQQRMVEYAKSKGLKGFTADILANNRAMLSLAKKCGNVTHKLSRDVYEVEMLFD